MEALEDSNCPSMSDSFSLYERYLRTFNVVDTFLVKNQNLEGGTVPSNGSVGGLLQHDNFDLPKDVLSNINSTLEAPFSSFSHAETETDEFEKKLDSDLHHKASSSCHPFESGFHMENSSVTGESNLTEKSENTDVPVSSEDSISNSKHPKPVIITSLITMENSNNAVDSVPMFRDVRPSDTVFKLPIRELTFNGTLKHVQKLKPIVDPLRALTSANSDLENDVEISEHCVSTVSSAHSMFLGLQNNHAPKINDTSNERSVSDNVRADEASESTGDSQYEEVNPRVGVECPQEDSNVKWSMDQSYSSLEASFDSGVRSPDMFSDDDDASAPETENFWDFLKDLEAKDKYKVRKMEETLQGVLPPPSVTTLNIDVTGMLKKYYGFLPAFNDDTNTSNPDINSTTPKKLTSLVKIPVENELADPQQEMAGADKLQTLEKELDLPTKEQETIVDNNLDTSKSDTESKSFLCKAMMSSETELREKAWPDILKCRFYDVHYNLTKFTERIETLAQKCGERFVGVETDSSVTVYSGGLQSPNSASKRKALRLKLAQAKSPGRRLSHLARRRQAFCSAATLGDKAHTSKMVLIDKNFFPHRKLVNTSERKSPRHRRTPGRKTPLKKTPSKTPKTRSGGSSRKKAMRRLLMDPDTLTRSQPTRETSKRALFISPDNRKPVPQVPSTSVPLQAMKSKRALFGSPIREAETKSLDGTISDQFLKRKRDVLDDIAEESKSKIAKSLSFGGDSMNPRAGHSLSRRASEMFPTKSNMAELDEHHRKKLLWAVSEALRSRGWRMQSPGFRDKAAALARLTRRLLTLPAHAARLHAPTLSTSDTLYKIAKQYVFAIIQGRTVEECFQEEQNRLANEENKKISGYISASAYQQLRNKPATVTHTTSLSQSSQIKENNCIGIKQEQGRSISKNILQDKLLNVDANSNSSGMSLLDKTGLYKSNSMPSFEEAAKMRARRQISFDNVDFPKR